MEGFWRRVAVRSLIVILKSWKYSTRNLLCTSLMINQNASERACHSRKIECAVSSMLRLMFMSPLLRNDQSLCHVTCVG